MNANTVSVTVTAPHAPRVLLTGKQIAAFTQVPLSTVKCWTRRPLAKGRLEARKVGKHLRFTPEDVAKFLGIEVSYLVAYTLA